MRKKISIEQIFLSALGSNQRLKWYLHHNINLVKYLETVWPQWLAFVDITFAFIPKKDKKKFIGDISIGRILGVLETERPDLFKTINSERGIEWLGKQIKNFEERFL